MIPIRDDVRTSRRAVVTPLLILVNIGVFIYQLGFGPLGYENYIMRYGLIPARVSHHPHEAYTFISAMFMHGGFGHLIGNMWFLWIFGDNVEDALGRGRFFIFYFVTGVLSFVAHTAMHPMATTPLIGASGAIAGVLGGYFLLFPRARVLTLVPIFFFVTTAQIPAAFFLGVWFFMQFLYSLGGGPVAWYAHIGGFISGLLLVKFFQKAR